mmetsp:Transcript_35137/g.139447  ORF Transcript_35137/g.139447 Transcript_35137/m.139447 type:complete len:156 (-) Transcript_35137:71-538(-)
MVIDTNPANSEEYKGFLGNLKYQRKAYFNFYYRWGDIFRSLDEANVRKWSRADEKEYADLKESVYNERLRHLVRKRDWSLLLGIGFASFITYRFTRAQPRLIPAVPVGILFGGPIGVATGHWIVSSIYGTWKYDDMLVWEDFSEWYIKKQKAKSA